MPEEGTEAGGEGERSPRELMATKQKENPGPQSSLLETVPLPLGQAFPTSESCTSERCISYPVRRAACEDKEVQKTTGQ